MRRTFILGTPLTLGGANTEAIHTALLWLSMGRDVSFLRIDGNGYNSPPNAGNPWLARLADAGCKFDQCLPGSLKSTPGLAESVVVAFCHSQAAAIWPELSDMGVRLIQSPCMNYAAPRDVPIFSKLPPTAVHYQSQHQASILRPIYSGWGVPTDRQVLIHGAFDGRDFPFSPRPHDGGVFVVGRFARGVRTKWSPRLWSILQAVRDAGVNVLALCAGWTPTVEEICGPPPSWARCYPPDTINATHFMQTCHALLCCNNGDVENWPRVGLEAMSSGVPVVADNAGGWKEMLGDGEYGYLCDSPAGFAATLVNLATREEWRQIMTGRAKAKLVWLTCPENISESWRALFAALDR